MLILLALVPWMLTLIVLFIIMISSKNNSKSYQIDEADEDFFMDDEDERDIVRVAVYDDKAYWVYDNVFYESEVMREPDFTTARPVDTMDLSPRELKRLLAILDELGQSNNERE